MVQDNRKWMRCGNCGGEHLEGPCPQYGDPRIPPKAESNCALKAALAAERSELDRLRNELEALKADIETYVHISSEQATENESLRKENAALREALQFYANPEVYKPHPHGLAFDRRDLSYRALAALQGAKDD